ncbi:ATP-binding cassette domain-containing protein [Rhodopila sp.]|uniref:ATP-binding cassette domain-containing protein n=1 Tax=Rhodopila sp. TaxID=2480087 RepID=UPI003D14A820
MAALLRIDTVSKSFGGFFAVRDVDLTVEIGDIHCLIGPNGAGKSTLFKLVVGTYAPTRGAIHFRDHDVTWDPPFARVQRGMSIKMQTPSVFKALPVRQNLHIALQHHVAAADLPREEERLLDLLGLVASATRLAGELSHGQQQWLEIGMAVALRPSLLLLDEPTAGLSPEETWRTGELVKRLSAGGMTVLAVEHDMAFVRQIATAVTVLHLGAIFARGSVADIVADPRVAEIYLGTPNAA